MSLVRLAQSTERKALNLVVVGLSPTVGVCACTSMAWQPWIGAGCQHHVSSELQMDTASALGVGGSRSESCRGRPVISGGHHTNISVSPCIWDWAAARQGPSRQQAATHPWPKPGATSRRHGPDLSSRHAGDGHLEPRARGDQRSHGG